MGPVALVTAARKAKAAGDIHVVSVRPLVSKLTFGQTRRESSNQEEREPRETYGPSPIHSVAHAPPHCAVESSRLTEKGTTSEAGFSKSC